jgi:hypothetical protein
MLQRPKNLEIMRKQRKQANRNPEKTKKAGKQESRENTVIIHMMLQ